MKASALLLASVVAGFVVGTSDLRAQSGGGYELRWFTIDAGGGTSTGGPYSLSGTIGQPDAGALMTGGTYSLVGGFWGVVAAIQTPGAPLLTATRDASSGTVTVSWPVTEENWVLEQTGTLHSSPAAIQWLAAPNSYQTNAGRITLTLPAPAGNQYFRLRRP